MGTNRSQVRDQLSGKTLGDLVASTLGDAGGRVFLNTGTGNDQTAVVSIADSFRAVHVPTLGQFIPQSGEFFTATVADTPNSIISPSDNQVFKVDTIGVQNATLGSLTATVSVKTTGGGSEEVIIATESVAAGVTKSVSLQNPIYIDKNATLDVKASGASLAYTIYGYKVVQ